MHETDPLKIKYKLSKLTLCCMTMLLIQGCGVLVRGLYNTGESINQSQWFYQGRHGSLSEQERQWASIAWQYFKNNYNSRTGLVNSVDKYPSTSMWHVGDTIAALVAARELELIKKKEFDSRFSTLLRFLNTMKLFKDRLPNNFYHTQNGKMVDHNNQPAGVGWSAIDIGRLLIWLRIIRARYPEYSEYIDRIILRFHFCDLLDRCGLLHSGISVQGKIDLYQGGGLGYEEYVALGYQMMGFHTTDSSNFHPYKTIKIFDTEIFYDARDPRESGTYAPVLSGPFLLEGLEFNWDLVDDGSTIDSIHSDKPLAQLAQNIYRVQEARYEQHRILTARTDHQLKNAPYFLYDSIFAAGYPWNTISDKGDSYPRLALVSTRATFGMWALWKTQYTDRLMKIMDTLYDAKRGWYEGRYEVTGGYERSLTSSTNAMVLEALLYKVQGKLYQQPIEPSYGEIKLEDIWRHPGKCFPPKRQQCDVKEFKDAK